MLQPRKALEEHVGGELALSDEIAEDPAMEQAVRAYVLWRMADYE